MITTPMPYRADLGGSQSQEILAWLTDMGIQAFGTAVAAVELDLVDAPVAISRRAWRRPVGGFLQDPAPQP